MRAKLGGAAVAALVLVCSIASVLVPTAGPAGAAPTGPLTGWSTAGIPLANGAIAFDGERDQVLVAVSDTVPELGNHLVELDPTDGSIGRTVWVGSRPSEVAVADDGSRAYVGLMGSPHVVEVDLTDFTVARRFRVGGLTTFGLQYPEDIEVVPGAPQTIVVSTRNLCCSARFESIVVLDAGVARPDVVDDHAFIGNRLELASPTLLHSYNNETTGYDLADIAIDAQGAHLVRERQLFTGFRLDMTYAGGRLHTTSGRVVDPATDVVEGSYGRTGPLAVDLAGGSTYVLGSAGLLTRHSTTTLLQTASRNVPMSDARQLLDAGAALVAANDEGLLLLGPGISGSGFEAPEAPPARLDPDGAAVEDLEVTSLVADPNGEVAYATVAMTDADHPGEVVELDPSTGDVLRSRFVGGGPNLVEVSDDGTRLYVGHEDASKVTELEVAGLTVVRSIPLSADGAPAYVGAIAPVPGDATRYAVQIIDPTHSPSHEGVLLVDAGTIRPDITRDHTGPTTIAFTADDPSTLYGINGRSTGYGFYRMAVDDDGITVVSEVGRLSEGFYQELQGRGDHVWSSNGFEIDPTVPQPIGRMAVRGLTAFDEEAEVAYVADRDDVWEVDPATYALRRPHLGALPADVEDLALADDTLLVATDELDLVRLEVGEQPAEAPGAPQWQALEPGDQQVALSWSPPTDDGNSPITGYRVYVEGEQWGETLPATARALVVDGLENGTSYSFQVSAVNAAGEGAKAVALERTPRAATVPSAPLAPVTTAGDTSVLLSWLAPYDGGAPIAGYRVYVDGQQRGPDLPPTQTDLLVDGLVNGQTYAFQVSAVNEVGEGPKTAASNRAPNGPRPPGAPTAFTATAGDARILLAWQPPADDGGSSVTAYRVFLDGVQHGADLPASARDQVVDGLENGIAHTVQVAAVSARGEGAKTAALTCTPAVAPLFRDVGPGHPFLAEITWAATEGITTGYADGTFRPAGVVTRQSMAAFLHRLAGAPDVTVPPIASFVDVGPTHPFFEEVEWVADAGIAGGYAGGTFRPGAPVTRQSMAAFLFRMAGSPDVVLPSTPSFSDVGRAHPFFEEVEWAAGEAITTGYEDATFRPSASVTRAATAAFLKRLVDGPGIDL
jgi:DNA-binding beta-propeller fold protein YncE